MDAVLPREEESDLYFYTTECDRIGRRRLIYIIYMPKTGSAVNNMRPRSVYSAHVTGSRKERIFYNGSKQNSGNEKMQIP